MMTSTVAWVLHRAGSYSPASFWQLYKFSDVSDLQSPIDGGSAVMMTSGVAWVLHRAGFYLLLSCSHLHSTSFSSFCSFPISLGKAENT